MALQKHLKLWGSPREENAHDQGEEESIHEESGLCTAVCFFKSFVSFVSLSFGL